MVVDEMHWVSWRLPCVDVQKRGAFQARVNFSITTATLVEVVEAKQEEKSR